MAFVGTHWTFPRLSRILTAKSKLGKGFSLLFSEHRCGAGGMMAGYRRGKRKIGESAHFIGADGAWADLAAWDIDAEGRFENVRIDLS